MPTRKQPTDQPTNHMSKRTLDSFLLPPPSSSSPATHKRTKHDPPEHRSGAQKHVALKGSTKKSNGGIEVVDLDEVIVLDTPSPSPEPSISLVIRKDKLSTSTLQDDDQRSPVGKSSTLLQSENEQNISSTTDPTPFRDAPLIPLPELAPQTAPPDRHSNYPFPIPSLPPHISTTITASPTSLNKPTTLTHLPHLDLLHYEPYLDSKTAREYGEFLRRELPFYRVEYKITRFGKVTDIRTPRYTVSLFSTPLPRRAFLPGKTSIHTCCLLLTHSLVLNVSSTLHRPSSASTRHRDSHQLEI